MADLRSIRVFVVGDVVRPGSYTVSGHAHDHQCAVRERRRQDDRLAAQHPAEAQRQARDDAWTSTTCCCSGDTSKTSRLQPGDVIFVPPVGVTVALSGEVRRPAIYELKGEGTAEELLAAWRRA